MMGSDGPEKILKYYEEWLAGHRREGGLVPEVQRARDAAEWQFKTWTSVQSSLPLETKLELESKYKQEYEDLRKNLPLPTDYSRHPFSAVVTGVTSSTMSTYYGVLSAKDAGILPEPVALAHLRSYGDMVDAQGRLDTLRTLLIGLFPRLADPFDTAVRTWLVARSQHDQAFAAAQALRTLLEQFNGQLIERARSRARENMPWFTMAERLVPASKPASELQIVRDQEAQHGRLFDRLSKIAKNPQAKSDEVESLWPLVVDHLYVICAAIHESA